MRTERLADAAIALHHILTSANIKYGIFGGFAIGCVGGPRQSKNVNCLAATTKEYALRLLDGREGFVAVQVLKPRDDYVTFLWSDYPERSETVLVEIFCEQFAGAQYSMQNIRCNACPVYGSRRGHDTIKFLDPFYLFKGMLRAAAYRNKPHDEQDLRYLESRYFGWIAAGKDTLSLEVVGLALRRYPDLETLFIRIGIDVAKAKLAVRGVNPDRAPVLGAVQRGLLG
ncbi:hypothetical protein CC78DRAFT_114146 [Lojkania enalia]|uniref:Uncharacterized protein n=1 Tax=Lojkania enalia TaxID=147567 RepID=A0A9P4K0L1_9PLEO|nr:hypothetical protein CC78DRAFT_114146 [Didymosphaeria enalia]